MTLRTRLDRARRLQCVDRSTGSLRELRWEKPEQFARSAAPIRIDERNARFRNFDVATGEFFNDSGKLWLVTDHHNGFAFDFPDHLPKPLKTEAVSELWLDLHSNRETLSDNFSRLRGPQERAG